MHRIIKKLKNNSLFFKLTLIMVISSISISVVTAFIIMQISKNIFINNFSITNNKILNQIQTSYSDLNDKLINIMSSVNNSWAFRKYLSEDNNNSLDEFSTIYSLKQTLKINEPLLDSGDIDFLAVGVNGSTYIRSSALLTSSLEYIKNSKITKKALETPDKPLYEYCNCGFTSLTQYNDTIMIAKVLRDQTTLEQFGMMYITINENEFSKAYSNFTTNGNDVLIVSSDGVIVSSNKKYMVGSINKNILDKAKKINKFGYKNSNIDIGAKSYTMLSSYMPIYNFYIVNLIDTKSALNGMYNINTIVMTCTIIICAAIFILFIVTKKTTNPLMILVKEMSKITEGNFNNHINLEGSYEIKKLSNSFNYMLDGLNDYIEKLLVAQKARRKSELSALQMQINPHFMYNTLASIKYLIIIGDKEKSVETLNSFISLLQNTISDTSETVTVKHEIENLKNYVLINQVRYGSKIKVNFHVFPKCENCQIPKLILQPFIENAFFHAFAGDKEGFIHVFISEKKNNLFCEIIDNGIGMSNEQIEKLNSPSVSNKKHYTGIGIKNVDNRIKLLYGDNYGINITSKLGYGTTISITLPMIVETTKNIDS